MRNELGSIPSPTAKMETFKFGDLVEIDYPYTTKQVEVKRKANGFIVQSEKRENTIVHHDKRLGIVVSDKAMDRVDIHGNVTEECIYSVYDAEQRYIYPRIAGLYLTLLCSI